MASSFEEPETPDDLSSGNHSSNNPPFSPGDTPSDDSIPEERHPRTNAAGADQADPPPVAPAAFRDEVRPEAIIHEPRHPRTNASIHADNEDPDELVDE